MSEQSNWQLVIQGFHSRLQSNPIRHPGFFWFFNIEEIGQFLSLPLRPLAFGIDLHPNGRVIVLRPLTAYRGEPSYWPPPSRARIAKARSRTPIWLQEQGFLWLEQTIREIKLAIGEQRLLIQLISDARYAAMFSYLSSNLNHILGTSSVCEYQFESVKCSCNVINPCSRRQMLIGV